MKKITLTLFFLGLINLLSAQEKGKFRTGLDVGFAVGTGESAGFIIGVEPKYNIKDNLNVGLRIEVGGIVKDVHYLSGNDDEYDSKIQANYNFMAVSDYYFHNSGGGSFAPFVGAGVGLNSVANVFYSSYENDIDAENIKIQTVFGGMIRGGFEWGKFRVTAQYNIIPKTNLQDTSGFIIGKAKNNYFGLSLGFYLGGGKWHR